MPFDTQGFDADMNDLFGKPGGFLHCGTCDRVMPMRPDDGSNYLRHGWPRCCGLTMRLWTAEQVQRGEAPLNRRLDPTTHARTTDPGTSHEAAHRLSDKRTMMRELLYAFRAGTDLSLGYTAEDATAHCAYGPGDGAWKRVSDLSRLGLIEPSGTTRAGASGRQQRVFVITDAGRAELQ